MSGGIHALISQRGYRWPVASQDVRAPLFWCPVPRRFNSLGVLNVSIPTNPLSPKKVATSDDEQAQRRPGQLRSSRQSPALSGHLSWHQVVAFLTVSCMPKKTCQRNVAVGGERFGEHGNFANSTCCGNGPLESNGIRTCRIPSRHHQRTEKQPHRVFLEGVGRVSQSRLLLTQISVHDMHP